MDTSPHKSDFVQVNGIKLHYLDWGGSGDALLFLAGMGCNAHIFDDFAPRFVDQFHIMALTRRTDSLPQPEATSTCTPSIREFVVFTSYPQGIRGRLSPTDAPAETQNPPQ